MKIGIKNNSITFFRLRFGFQPPIFVGRGHLSSAVPADLLSKAWHTFFERFYILSSFVEFTDHVCSGAHRTVQSLFKKRFIVSIP